MCRVRSILSAVLMSVVAAAASEAADAPVPPTAERVLTQSMDVNRLQGTATSFQTGDTPQQVLTFYQEQLPKDKWSPMQIPSFDKVVSDPNMLKVAYFQRGDQHLVVNAQRQPGYAKTMVSVARWKLNVKDLPQAPPSDNGTTVTMPGAAMAWGSGDAQTGDKISDVLGVPPYPGAARDFGMRDPQLGDFQMVSYVTKDASGEAASFYQRTMPLHGWKPASGETAEVAEEMQAQAKLIHGTMLVYESSDQLAMILLRPAVDQPGTAIDVMVSKHPRRELEEAFRHAQHR